MTKQRDKLRRVTGAEFTALMEHYGLRSNEGAALVAKLLYQRPNSIYMAYQRGLLRTEFELLEWKLAQIAQGTSFE